MNTENAKFHTMEPITSEQAIQHIKRAPEVQDLEVDGEDLFRDEAIEALLEQPGKLWQMEASRTFIYLYDNNDKP